MRGKGGLAAAESVVAVLEDKADITLGYFMAGLVCIVISSSLKAFIQYSFLNALVVSIGLVAMTYVLVMSGRRIFKNMYVEKGSAISGKIT